MLGLSLWYHHIGKTLGPIIRAGLLVGGGALIYNEYRSFWGLEPGVAFLTLLASLKTFELKSRRDFFIFVLIVELSLSAHVLTVDALYMVAYVLGLSLALFALLFTFHTADVEAPWSKHRRKVFLKIFALSVPMAICLFMLFPRLTLGNFFFNTIKKVNYTGFTDHVNPGAISSVINNKTPYFRAKFEDGKTPSIFELYWRGAILSQTDGFSWKRGRTGEVKEEEVLGPAKFNYSVDFDLFMDGPLFLLGENLEYQKKSRGYVLQMGGSTFKFFPYGNQKIKYTAQTGRTRVLKLDEQSRLAYLLLPESSAYPRFSKWVESLNLKDKSLRQKLNVFSKYIGSQKFEYSLTPGAIRGPTPLDQFFFDKRVGLCEHYASALGIFLRLQGVPTRLVVGFHGGNLNPIGDYFLITGQDAHAWVEAWHDKKGWRRVDPTNWIAPERIRYGSEAYFAPGESDRDEPMEIFLRRQNNKFFRKALFAFDMIYFELNREFVGFDLERQSELFSFLGVRNKFWPWKLIILCAVLVTIILAPLTYWLYRSTRRAQPIDRVFERFERLMRRLGLERIASEGPVDYLARCQQRFPPARKRLQEFIDTYISAKYGSRSPSEILGPLKRSLSEIKKTVKNNRES
jgi:hypothetical protein